jgi:hypothetical protein
MDNPIFSEACTNSRTDIKAIGKNIMTLRKTVMGWPESETLSLETKSEILANVMLCYRHLEDAQMRIEKAIQAFDGGVSVYDKQSTMGVVNGPDPMPTATDEQANTQN